MRTARGVNGPHIPSPAPRTEYCFGGLQTTAEASLSYWLELFGSQQMSVMFRFFQRREPKAFASKTCLFCLCRTYGEQTSGKTSNGPSQKRISSTGAHSRGFAAGLHPLLLHSVLLHFTCLDFVDPSRTMTLPFSFFLRSLSNAPICYPCGSCVCRSLVLLFKSEERNSGHSW